MLTSYDNSYYDSNYEPDYYYYHDHCFYDPWGCFQNEFRNLIRKIYLNYTSVGLQLIIVLISIFGKIKEDYKWFCLNQALFNMAMAWVLQICEHILIADIYSGCFGNHVDTRHDLNAMIANIGYRFYEKFPIFLYLNLLLFTFTRFVATYFPIFYSFRVKGRVIFYLIVFFDVFLIVFLLLFSSLYEYFDSFWYKKKSVLPKIAGYLDFIFHILCGVFMFCSVLASLFTLSKLLKHTFWEKNSLQKSMMFNRLSISIALSLQNVIQFFTVFVSLLAAFQIFAYNGLGIETINWSIEDVYLSTRYESAQVCIFMDSFTTLFIMSGYRNRLWDVIKFVVLKIRGVSKKYLNKNGSSVSSVSILSKK